MNDKYLEFINIPGPIGGLESVIHNVPHAATSKKLSHVWIICHPHPLYQGSMQNKVVTTVARTFVSMGMPCVRFNFRGVGKSDGSFADAIGEAEDCMAVFDWVKNRWDNVHICLAGFSFGAYVATLTAVQRVIAQLITIAPPVHYYNFNQLTINCPSLIIQGEDDEIVPAVKVYQWYEILQTKKTLIKMPDTTHFFHGKLRELQENIKAYVKYLPIMSELL